MRKTPASLITVAITAVLVTVAGCRHASAAADVANAPKLKAMLKRSDALLVKHFYTSASVAADHDPKFESIIPARTEIEPVWVYEPGKEAQGLKGAIITVWVSGVVDDEHPDGPRKESATLDLDELHDLDNALIALQSESAPWRGQHSDGHVEMQFLAKDDFDVSAFHSDTDGDILYVEAGGAAAGLSFSKTTEFEKAVRDCISLLESKK
jgi:hypothetical protein